MCMGISEFHPNHLNRFKWAPTFFMRHKSDGTASYPDLKWRTDVRMVESS